MEERGWLGQILEQAEKEVNSWPAWMRPDKGKWGKVNNELMACSKRLRELRHHSPPACLSQLRQGLVLSSQDLTLLSQYVKELERFEEVSRLILGMEHCRRSKKEGGILQGCTESAGHNGPCVFEDQ